MTERQLSDAVYELATLLGWTSYHTYNSQRSQPGFPDLVLVRNGHLLFVELKAAKGVLSPAQQEWIEQLGAVSVGVNRVQVYQWRPANWLNGDIETVLRFTGTAKGIAA